MPRGSVGASAWYVLLVWVVFMLVGETFGSQVLHWLLQLYERPPLATCAALVLSKAFAEKPFGVKSFIGYCSYMKELLSQLVLLLCYPMHLHFLDSLPERDAQSTHVLSGALVSHVWRSWARHLII